MKTLQKFAAAHASIHNHFNDDRHLNPRDICKRKTFCRARRVASAGGLNASDEHPSQARSGLSNNAPTMPPLSEHPDYGNRVWPSFCVKTGCRLLHRAVGAVIREGQHQLRHVILREVGVILDAYIPSTGRALGTEF